MYLLATVAQNIAGELDVSGKMSSLAFLSVGISFRDFALSCLVISIFAGLFWAASRLIDVLGIRHLKAFDLEVVNRFDRRKWRIKNTSISLLHSTLSGLWALSSFFLYPEMCEDLIYSQNVYTKTLVLMSMGYFFYDGVDLWQNEKPTRAFELLFHHFMCLTTFVCAVVAQKFWGYAAVALLMELNSIFLHARMLITLQGTSKCTPIYRITSLINIFTFVVCRLLVMAWMSRWLLRHHTDVEPFYFAIAAVGLAFLTVVNLCLFHRILTVDYFAESAHLTRKTSAKDH